MSYCGFIYNFHIYHCMFFFTILLIPQKSYYNLSLSVLYIGTGNTYIKYKYFVFCKYFRNDFIFYKYKYIPTYNNKCYFVNIYLY